MSDFIREVDEGVRQDKARRFLERYWVVLLVLAILILAGVGAFQGYDYLRTQRAQTAGGQFLGALDLARDGKSAEAEAGLRSVVADGTPGYRLLARFRLAGEVGAKDKAEGAKLFDAIAADAGVDPALQNVARLRAAMLLLDSSSYADFKTRMEPLADANNPVRNAARELLALAALKADKPDEAGRDLDAIASDPMTSDQARQRIDALQGLVRGSGNAPVPPAAATPPVAPAPSAAAAPAVPTASAPAADAAPVTTAAPEAPAVVPQPTAPGPVAPVSEPSATPPAQGEAAPAAPASPATPPAAEAPAK